jgi:hypothetical protein
MNTAAQTLDRDVKTRHVICGRTIPDDEAKFDCFTRFSRRRTAKPPKSSGRVFSFP